MSMMSIVKHIANFLTAFLAQFWLSLVVMLKLPRQEMFPSRLDIIFIHVNLLAEGDTLILTILVNIVRS